MWLGLCGRAGVLRLVWLDWYAWACVVGFGCTVALRLMRFRLGAVGFGWTVALRLMRLGWCGWAHAVGLVWLGGYGAWAVMVVSVWLGL